MESRSISGTRRLPSLAESGYNTGRIGQKPDAEFAERANKQDGRIERMYAALEHGKRRLPSAAEAAALHSELGGDALTGA